MSILLPVVIVLGMAGFIVAGIMAAQLIADTYKELFLSIYRYWRGKLKEAGWG